MLRDVYLCALAFLGCLLVAVLYQSEKRLLIPAGFSGSLGLAVYLTFMRFWGIATLATFAGAVAVTLYAELTARRFRIPATILIIMGIFPVVPGAAAYDTVMALVRGRYKEAGPRGLVTLVLAMSMAFGILLVASAFRAARFLRARRPPR